MGKMIRIVRMQWFSLALVAAFLVSWAAPWVGVGINPGNHTQYWAIVTIFFLSGLILPTREAFAGLLNWRVHVFINLFQFVLVPLGAWLALKPFRDSLDPGLLAGFCLLAALPTTISSCVTFTQISGGNVAASLFNAAAGNIAGIAITPALLFLMLGGKADHSRLDIVATILSLTRQVIVPFFIGQAIYLAAGGRTKHWRKKVASFNSFLIILIVFTAFSDTFAHTERLGGFSLANPRFVAPLAALLPIHLAVLATVAGLSRAFRFNPSDRVAIFYTASQKTLSLGLPMATATLGANPRLLGLAILPIIVYHPIQLLVAGMLRRPAAASKHQ
ncbi:MAG: bile acid:sodium symporter [Candidatus Sumerlaeia bacterium]